MMLLAFISVVSAWWGCCDHTCCERRGQMRCAFQPSCSYDRTSNPPKCRFVDVSHCSGVPKDNTLRTHTLKHEGYVNSVALGLNPELLLSGSSDRTAVLWNLTTSSKISTYHTDDQVVTVALSEFLVVFAEKGRKSGRLHVFDIRNNHELTIPQSHRNQISAVAISDDGKRIASGGYDGQIVIYQRDPKTGHFTHLCFLSYDAAEKLKGQVTSLALSGPDGAYVVVGDTLNAIKVWDIANERTIRAIVTDATVADVAMSSTTAFIYGAATARGLSVVDYEDRGMRQSVHVDLDPDTEFTSLSMSEDGKYIVGGAFDSRILVWDRHTRTNASTVPIRVFKHNARVTSVVLSRTCAFVASGSLDNTVGVWKVDVDEKITTTLTELATNGSNGITERQEEQLELALAKMTQ